MRTRIAIACCLATTLVAGAALPQASGREIAFVANAEAATVSLIDVADRRVLTEIDVNPDKATVQRAGTQNFAQDTDISPDGRILYVSRGYLGDVVAIDIGLRKLLWKTRVDPVRADHMVLTPDGRHLFVSALTSNRVVRLDARTGAKTGEVVSGVYPHDNQLSRDGRVVFNASLGNMGTPAAQRDNVTTPGDRSGYAYQITVFSADDLKVADRIRMHTGVRPFHLTPDGKAFYAQTHSTHGLMTYDIARKAVTNSLALPVAEGVTSADFEFEAPHHGLAITPDGRTLCLAGRASDYAAFVRAPELTLLGTVKVGDGPSWAEFADGGRVCLLPNSRSDDVSIVSTADRTELVRLKVGDGPKHITVARVPPTVLAALRGG